MTDPASTEAIIKAMRALAQNIQTEDGVANAAIRQAAERLEEQEAHIGELKEGFSAVVCEHSQLIEEGKEQAAKIKSLKSLLKSKDEYIDTMRAMR